MISCLTWNFLAMNPYFSEEILKELHDHHTVLSKTPMRQLFADDPERFQTFSCEAAGLFLDYSKNRIVPTTLQLLIDLAQGADLQGYMDALLSGQNINFTEHRPALHTALRDPSDVPLYVSETNIKPHIKHALNKMRDITIQLQSRNWKGYSDKPLTHVVHIGIGGSHLGPKIVVEALSDHVAKTGVAIDFVSSLDATELEQVLKNSDPETTLFIIASKTFTTQETLVNAERARQWLQNAAGPNADLSHHFIATTAAPELAIKWGVTKDYILPSWDWVGGRYSLWSTMGLPIAIAIGMNNFELLLAGAHEMDKHFQETEFSTNMPIILGLLSFWNAAFFKVSAHAVLPYDYRLRSLPHHLQQLSMESNGKSVHYDGSAVTGLTAPILFGEKGTEGQHSFYQLLLQGTHVVSCDFIATLRHHASEAEQPLLLAHCFAQSQALMMGKTAEEVIATLQKQGYTQHQAAKIAPHKVVKGNQPSNTILMHELTPRTLGALLALYEHKTFVEGVLWYINSFDQWGVELGKEIAKDIAKSLLGRDDTLRFDASTQGLIEWCIKNN